MFHILTKKKKKKKIREEGKFHEWTMIRDVRNVYRMLIMKELRKCPRGGEIREKKDI